MATELKCIYFSATDTTRRYVEILTEAIGLPVKSVINLADNQSESLPEITADDLVIVAAPVYGGRIPQHVSSFLNRLHGNGAKTIAMVVFGNRDYDDALLELTDILSDTGFSLIGAAAVIGQHSIFPKVASGRPDAQDVRKVREFASRCMASVEKETAGELSIKGNRPYKKAAGVSLSPVVDVQKCVICGKCAGLCPAQAICPTDVTKTDTERCIACGRCIHICPKNARKHSGLKYRLIGAIFTSAFSRRKEPDFYPSQTAY